MSGRNAVEHGGRALAYRAIGRALSRSIWEAAVVRVRLHLHVGPPQSWAVRPPMPCHSLINHPPVTRHQQCCRRGPFAHALILCRARACRCCCVRVHDGPADAAGHASMIRGRVLACKGRFALLACISGSIEFGYTTPPIHHHRSNSP